MEQMVGNGTLEQSSEAEQTSAFMSDLAKLIDDTIMKARREVEGITESTRALSVNAQEAVELLIEKNQNG